jgi:uncharacterized membrane protein
MSALTPRFFAGIMVALFLVAMIPLKSMAYAQEPLETTIAQQDQNSQETPNPPVSIQPLPQPTYTEGKIIRIVESGKEFLLEELVPYQVVLVRITKGELQGKEMEIRNSASFGEGVSSVQYEEYEPDQKVRIVIVPDGENGESYALAGRVKRDGLLMLAAIFLIVVLVVGRIWGALSILGMAVSFLVIFRLIIPLIISGTHPVVAALLGSLIIIPTTFYISHGFNAKTHVGVIATLIALLGTGLLAIYFVEVTHLTGFASEEAGFLQVERHGSIDIRGLLLAGIIIGTLGILDDVTVGQASVVQQIKKNRPDISLRELFLAGMKVGQDHISSMVNTLVLVYSGSALPLLLLFFGNEQSFWDITEYELIAEEIVRMLVGSIGLVAVAPLATFLAAWIFTTSTGKHARRE